MNAEKDAMLELKSVNEENENNVSEVGKWSYFIING
jgi:hypothetical protein